jgi:DNA-binding CsgD family transcriptional regulator
VLVAGPAGIGKSALVEEALDGVAARVAVALPSRSDVAYWPLMAAFGWGTCLGEPPEVARAARAEMSTDEVLVVEDVHWADPATVAVLRSLAADVGLLCTSQGTDAAVGSLRSTIREVGGDVIELGPLDAGELAAMLRESSPELLSGECHRLAVAAGGHPLLAQLLAASPDRRRDLAEGGAHTASVSAILMRHSVAARQSLLMLGAAPAALERDQLVDLDALLDSGLVRSSDGDMYEAAHRLFTEPSLLRLDDGQQQEVFARLAAMDGLSDQLRAEYLLAAGDPAAALECAVRAAEGPLPRAGQAAALSIAARASGALRASGGELDDDHRRRHERLVIDAARALNDGTDFEQAAAVLGDVGSLSDTHRAAGVVEALRAALGRGDRRHAAATCAAASSWLDGLVGPDAALAGLILGSLERWHGVEGIGVAEWDELLSAAQGASCTPAELLARMAAPRSGVADIERWSEAARVAAASRGDLASELDAARNLVMLWISVGRQQEGRELARASAQRAEAAGERAWAIELRTLDHISRFYDGDDHDEVLSWLSFVRTAPVRLETRAMATSILATLLADRGAVRRSGEVLRPWLEPEVIEAMAPLAQALLAWGAAQRAWSTGDLAEAIRVATWVTATVPQGYPSLAGTQVVWRWSEYELGRPLSAPDPTGGLLDAAALEAAALELLAAGDHSAAAGRFMAAADSWRPILWRCNLRARWGAGHALALAGERERAAQVLRDVDAELDRSGFPALRPRVAASLRSIGLGLSGGVARPASGGRLTHQERQVMSLVVDGLTTDAIARRLGVSAPTVNSHVNAAKRKLGARTRTEAAAMVGLEQG